MSPEKWQKIKEIFNEAVELAPDEWEFVLKNETDAEIAAEVRKLLAAEKLNNFENPVADISNIWQDEKAEDFIGKQIGNYKITKEIGRGGMGIVFEAVRSGEDFSQTVALKMLKRGMDSDAIRRRFRSERQILATLEHPHIARLLDGGITGENAPFLVMEFVQGQPLDEFCDERSLSINERLRLFLQVCAAVSFAHSRLVVHRDLKPSNIFVTPDGTVKLLDFGIAKILTPENENLQNQTVTALGMMTPQYASPEQIKGEIVSTSSDIYSLGLVLYELLTGANAYHFPNNRPDEMAKIICESEPPKPSAITNYELRITNENRNPKSKIQNPKSLRGDLDNIILKALRKEPARRYASVEQFANDIKKHLEGLPVIARSDTFSYRFEKFVKRNRVPVFAGFLIFLSLVGGIAATTYQARRAEQQKVLAEKRFNQVRELAGNVVFKYHDEIKDLQGATHVRQVLVEDALKYLDNLQEDSAGDMNLTIELAQAYMRVGSVQGGAYQANLGDSKGAAESYEKAIKLLEPLAENSNEAKLLSALRDAYIESSRAFYRIGEIEKQNENLKKALPLSEKIAALDPENFEPKIHYARGLVYYGDSLLEKDETGKIEFYRKGLKVIDEVLAGEPDDETANRMLATATHRLQMHLSLLGDAAGKSGNAEQKKKFYDEALSFAERSSEAQKKVLLINPENPLYQRNVAGSKLNLGKIYRELGNTETAINLANEALKMQIIIAEKDADNQEIKLDQKESYDDLMLAYTKRGDFEKASENFQKSVELNEKLLKKDPENLDFWIARLRGEQIFADALLEKGATKQAKSHYLDALARAEARAPKKYASWVEDFRKEISENLEKCG